MGKRASGLSTCGRISNGARERASGTKTSVIWKSFEPVPRRPDVYQVSRISTSDRWREHEVERAVVPDRPADDPVAVLGAAPPHPPPGHALAALDADPAARGRERAPGDDGGIAVDLLRPRRLEEAAEARGRAGDHHAPARGAVGRRDRLDGLDQLHGRGLGPAVGRGDAQPHQPGADQRLHDRVGEPAPLLGLVGVGGRRPAATPARRRRWRSRMLHAPPTPASRRASAQPLPCSTSMSCGRPSARSPRMLRCTSPVPPPIVSAAENRNP